MKLLIAALSLTVTLTGCDQSAQNERMTKAEARVSILEAQVFTLLTASDVHKEKIGVLENELKQTRATKEPARLPQTDAALLKLAIEECVIRTRKSAPTDSGKNFFEQFDAFYNPATGTVKNNAIYNGSLPALYEFNKCLSSKGFPLT